MLRTASVRLVGGLLVGLFGLVLALALALGVGARPTTAAQATVQGQDVPLAPGDFQLEGGPPVSTTRTVLDIPPGQPNAAAGTA